MNTTTSTGVTVYIVVRSVEYKLILYSKNLPLSWLYTRSFVYLLINNTYFMKWIKLVPCLHTL